MPLELKLLGWSVVLLLVQIVAQAATATSELGLPYNMSPRDDGRQPRSVYAGRMHRALHNLLETYPAFVALALALVRPVRPAVSGKPARKSIWRRASFISSIYAAGVSVIRTLVWGVSIVGLMLMLVRLLS